MLHVLREFADDSDKRAILWAASPAISRLGRLAQHDLPPQRWPRIRNIARRAYGGIAKQSPVTTWAAPPILIATTTENQSRVARALLKAVMAELNIASAPTPTPKPSRAPMRQLTRFTKAADLLISRSRAHLISHSSMEPSTIDFLASILFNSALAIARSHEILTVQSVRLLVVATQHSYHIRALCLEARRRGIATIYFPHAPVADNSQYRDLPFDHAGLRGQAEVEFYRSIGVFERESFQVTGNPTIDTYPPVRIGTDAPILLGLSPASRTRLEQIVDLVRPVERFGVRVAPHPASDVRLLRKVLPRSWEISERGRTMAELLSGPRCLLVQSSGVALEALLLGLPVIELSLGGRPNYPFIRPPWVPIVSDSRSLADQLAEIFAEGPDVGARGELIRWAEYWCSPLGEASIQACGRALMRALSLGLNNELLLDAWGDQLWT